MTSTKNENYSSKTYNTLLNTFEKNETNKGHFIDKTKPYLLNDSIFNLNNIKVLSSMITGSGTYVINVSGKGKYSENKFVVKYTPIYSTVDIQKTKNECLIYSYIRNLIKNNICPFLYYGFECNTYTLSTEEIRKLPPEIGKKLKKQKISISILNTNNKNTIIKALDELIYTFHEKAENYIEFLIILFQIMYTLKCFQIIGLKHNDLRFGNIMIEEKIKYDDFGTFNKYVIDDSKSYFLPNIKYTVKIFDFDLSEKFNVVNNLKDEYKNIDEFEPLNFKKEQPNTFLNNDNDVNYDLLKVIFYIIYYGKFKDLINSFFKDTNVFDNMTKDKSIIEAEIEKNKAALGNIPNLEYTAESITITTHEETFPFDKFGNFSSKFKKYGNIKTIDEIMDIIYLQIQNKLQTKKQPTLPPTPTDLKYVYYLSKLFKSKPLSSPSKATYTFTPKARASDTTTPSTPLPTPLPTPAITGGYKIKSSKKKAIKSKLNKKKINLTKNKSKNKKN
jgi:hypothetical protein